MSAELEPLQLAEGEFIPYVFLPYQQEFMADVSAFRIVEKSRRIGITWAAAAEAVINAAIAKGGGGMDTWYMVNNLDDAREFIRDCAEWALKLNLVASTIGKFIVQDVDGEGNSRDILAFRINFRSGHKIVALSSRPRRLRGKSGHAILDEAAHHDDVDEFLKAAAAFTQLGGRVTLISTHNGEDSVFNRCCREAAQQTRPYSLHTYPFKRAINDGYYELIACPKLRIIPTAKGKADYIREVYAQQGSNADEELNCKPRGGHGKYFSQKLLTSAARPGAFVEQLRREDEFLDLPQATKTAEIRTWLRTVVDPLLAELDPGSTYAIGQDFGRRRDLTAVALWECEQSMRKRCVGIFELSNIPFAEQELVLWHVIEGMPKAPDDGWRLTRVGLEASNNGAQLAESTMLRYGRSLVFRVQLQGGIARPEEKRKDAGTVRYSEILPAFKDDLEIGSALIPQHLDVLSDLRAFEVRDGIPYMPAVRTKGRRGETRHGDDAVALVIGHHMLSTAPIDNEILLPGDFVDLKTTTEIDPLGEAEDAWENVEHVAW